MERILVPYKTTTQIATYQGEWTAEQIENGEAGEASLEVYEAWYEPSEDGPVLVTDAERIQELERTIRK